MLIKISPALGYGYELEPVSVAKLHAIRKDMRKNGCVEPPRSVYFQNWEHLEIDLADMVPARVYRELDEGYPVCCRMDDWTVRHLFGYCAD